MIHTHAYTYVHYITSHVTRHNHFVANNKFLMSFTASGNLIETSNYKEYYEFITSDN